MANQKNTNGKLPPQAVELEDVVLGAAIDVRGAASEMIEIFRKENVFYKPVHQEIYNTIVELYNENIGIDLLTISDRLKKRGKLEAVGGDFYLISLTQKVTSSAHIEFHCRVIQEQFVKRKAIAVAGEIMAKAYEADEDIFDLLDESYKSLDSVSDWLFMKKPDTFKANVDKLFESANNKTEGVPSSIVKMHNKLNGYQNSNLIILAARPGMGKTAYIINEALGMARKGIPVGIFSMEMSARELTARLMANYCGINATAISLNQTEPHELRLMNQKRPDFEKLPIFIHDQPAMTPLEVKVQAKKWHREHGVKMIFLDYLQLMQNGKKNGNREQEVSEISRSLKGVAKEVDIPVMALSQLSRAVEQRGGNKRPILSDLRESGSIEQDADIVKFIYRPEYYGIEEWDDDNRSPTKNQAEIIIAKFRNGQPGACLVGCDLQYMRFMDLEEDNFIPPTPEPNKDLNNAWDDLPNRSDDTDDLPF